MAAGGLTVLAPVEARRGQGVQRLPVWAVCLLLFAASRIVTTLLFVWTLSTATPQSRAGAHPSLLELATQWDGQWYWLIGTSGYPSTLPLTAAGTVDTNQWAFLPVYPLLSKLLTFGVLDWRISALAVAVAAGFGAAVLLGALLLPHLGRDRTLFSVALFSVSPLSFVLQTAYAESLGLLLLLAALLLIDRGRHLAAIPVAVVLAFTRPGVQALSLTVGLLLVVQLVRWRRGGPPVPPERLGSMLLLAAVSAAAGFAWSVIAAFATGRPDAYFATEGAWRALWMPDGDITLFEPWYFAARFWSDLVVGGAGVWVAPLVLAVVVLGFAALLLSPPARRLGSTVRLWCASWAVYLLAVFFPQSSVFRLLMPMAPLLGAVVPQRRAARIGLLVVSVALQALWLWVCYGPRQEYWTVP